MICLKIYYWKSIFRYLKLLIYENFIQNFMTSMAWRKEPMQINF